jgi:hypothetical protein
MEKFFPLITIKIIAFTRHKSSANNTLLLTEKQTNIYFFFRSIKIKANI